VNEKKDPDLLRHFVCLQSKTFEKYRDFLLGLNEFEEIIEFVFLIFLSVQEITLTKEILIFFQLVFGTKSISGNPQIVKNVPKLVEVILFMLPEVFPRSQVAVSEVFTGLLDAFGDNQAELSKIFFLTVQKNPKFQIFDENKQKIFVQAIFKFAKSPRDMKVTLSVVTDIMNQVLSLDDFMTIELLMVPGAKKNKPTDAYNMVIV